jgi:uncharacterized membrane protein
MSVKLPESTVYVFNVILAFEILNGKKKFVILRFLYIMYRNVFKWKFQGTSEEVRYVENFVIQRGSLWKGSTVCNYCEFELVGS